MSSPRKISSTETWRLALTTTILDPNFTPTLQITFRGYNTNGDRITSRYDIGGFNNLSPATTDIPSWDGWIETIILSDLGQLPPAEWIFARLELFTLVNTLKLPTAHFISDYLTTGEPAYWPNEGFNPAHHGREWRKITNFGGGISANQRTLTPENSTRSRLLGFAGVIQTDATAGNRVLSVSHRSGFATFRLGQSESPIGPSTTRLVHCSTNQHYSLNTVTGDELFPIADKWIEPPDTWTIDTNGISIGDQWTALFAHHERIYATNLAPSA